MNKSTVAVPTHWVKNLLKWR